MRAALPPHAVTRPQQTRPQQARSATHPAATRQEPQLSAVAAPLRAPRAWADADRHCRLGACFVAIRYGLVDAPGLWFAALRALSPVLRY